MTWAKGWSAPKSLTTRCSGREQPRCRTLALRTKGRSRWPARRYCGSTTLISPKVVCQHSFFTLAPDLSAATKLLLQAIHLPLGPRLQRLLAHPRDLFDQPQLGRISFFQLPRRILHNGQQRCNPIPDLWVRIEPLQNLRLAQLRRVHHHLLPGQTPYARLRHISLDRTRPSCPAGGRPGIRAKISTFGR